MKPSRLCRAVPLLITLTEGLAGGWYWQGAFNSSGSAPPVSKLAPAAARHDPVSAREQELVATNLKVNGPEHPGTLVAMTNLAVFLGIADRTAEAIALQEKSLAIMRRVMPPAHHHFSIALGSMAALYEIAGRNDEAAKLRTELGEQAPATALVKKEVKPLEAALEITRKAKGAEHVETIAARTELAAAQGAEGSGRKAIKLGEEALALARRVLPAGDPHTAEAMKVLVPLYRSVDLEVNAAKLEAELQAMTRITPEPQ